MAKVKAKKTVKTQDQRHCPVCGEKFTEEDIKNYRDFGHEVGSPDADESFPPFCSACGEDGYTDM